LVLIQSTGEFLLTTHDSFPVSANSSASIVAHDLFQGAVSGYGVSGSVGSGELTFEVVPSHGEQDVGQTFEISIGSVASCDTNSPSGLCTLSAAFDAGSGNAGSLSCSASAGTSSRVDARSFQVPYYEPIDVTFAFNAQEAFDTTGQGDLGSADGDIIISAQPPMASPRLVTTASLPAVTLDSSGHSPTLTDSAVLSGGDSETGTIEFILTAPDGETVLDDETVPVHGDGTYSTPSGYTLPTTGAQAGTYTWTASYSGDTFNNPADDQGGLAEQTIVSLATPTLVARASPPDATLDPNNPTQMTDSAVLSGGDDPTGKIEFILTAPDGTTVLDDETVPVDGDGTYSTPSGYTLPTTGAQAGTYTWTASYSGDPANDPANDQGGPAEQTVVGKAMPTLVSAASPSPVLLDGSGLQVLTDSAQLSGGYDEGGYITFTLLAPDGVTILEQQGIPVHGDNMYMPDSGFPLPVTGALTGTYTWTASYGGDDNNNPANDQGGPPEQIVVTKTQTTTTLTSSTDPFGSRYGESVTFSARVSVVPPGLGHPTGEVDFFDNGQPLGSNMLSGFDATFSTNALHAGDHLITAVYEGDSNFSESTSDPYLQSVDRATTAFMGPFGESSVYGQKLTIFPIIFVSPDPPTLPTGWLALYEDSKTTPIVSQNLGAGAAGADLSTSVLTAGTHVLTVVYSGDGDFKPCAVTRTVEVAKAPLTVTADNNDIAHGAPVPALTWSFTGFVNGDTAAVVSGSPVLSNEASPRSSAGQYTITIAVGSLGAGNYFFPTLVPGTVTVHPKVVDVRVDYGTKSMSLIGLNRDLPFATISAIEVIFSDDVRVALGDLSLTGKRGTSYSLSSVSYNPTTYDATWSLPSAIGVDKLMLTVDGATFARDPANNVFHFDTKFAVLPGDINGDGVVNSQDLVLERNAILGIGDPSLVGWADVNGDGALDLNDFKAVRGRLGTRLPS
jgi:hypothetical protein